MALRFLRKAVIQANVIQSKNLFAKRLIITGYKKTDEVLENVTGGRINGWVEQIYDISGLSEVKRAQNKVLEAENLFQQKREERRICTKQLMDIQTSLHHVTKEREMATKGTQLYLTLVTKENEIIKTENELKANIQQLEEDERGAFNLMSSALRASQEVERAQARQMQQFSAVATLVGMILGAAISYIMNRVRMKQLQEITTSSSEMVGDCKKVIEQLSLHVQKQEDKTTELINLHHSLTGAGELVSNSKMKSIQPANHWGHSMEKCTEEILVKVKKQEQILDKEIETLKKMIGTNVRSGEGVVYVGPEMKSMLDDTEKHLEWKMKMTALGTATLVYGAVVITVPIIYAFLKGFGGS